MKTQLLEDFAQSGSAPAAPRPEPARQDGRAARAEPAAVWRRPQANDATWPNMSDATVLASSPPADADRTEVPGGESTARRAPGLADPSASTAGGTPPSPHANEVPDWLVQRLREESEHEAALQRKRLWARRALAWGGASGLLAMLAAGGFWFYQESRDEGALVVVANTSPARASAGGLGAGSAADGSVAARARLEPGAVTVPTLPVAAGREKDVAPRIASGLPLDSDVGVSSKTKVSTPDGVADTGKPAGAATKNTSTTAALPNWRPAGIRPAPPAQATVERTPPHRAARPKDEAAADVVDAPSAAVAQVPRGRPSRQRHADARAHANAPAREDGEPTRAQRREETLMQCRVLGYDERQCLRRGCEMTRYGLACKG